MTRKIHYHVPGSDSTHCGLSGPETKVTVKPVVVDCGRCLSMLRKIEGRWHLGVRTITKGKQHFAWLPITEKKDQK